MNRIGEVSRETSESKIYVKLNLDGTGSSKISTGVGFYDHMLTALSKHSLIDMEVETTGDIHIDGHHTIEDTAIAIGQALRQALGDKSGIKRYGDAIVPLDEALAQCVVDVAGRAYASLSGEPESQINARIGGLEPHYMGSMTYHVFESIAFNAGICIYLRLLAGRDAHHIVEAEYKALARALRAAVEPDERVSGIPSTKGLL